MQIIKKSTVSFRSEYGCNIELFPFFEIKLSEVMPIEREFELDKHPRLKSIYN